MNKEEELIDRLIDLAFAEDIGDGDHTTLSCIPATAMGKSKHSKTGKLSSKAGWVGLAKKFCILLMVVVAVRMDILIGTTYIRDATCIGFCVNELLSIIENTSLMGIPYPPAIKKAIEVLQKRASHIDDEIQEMIDNMEDDKK